jgi:hypothetical protein
LNEGATKQQATVELPRTGNPWIDCGIIGLFNMVEHGKLEVPRSIAVRLQEEQDKLVMSGESRNDIEDFLKYAFEQVKSNFYVEQTVNKVCIFNEEKDDFQVVPKINLVDVIGFLFSGGDLKVKYRKKPLTERLRRKLEKFKDSYSQRKNIEFKVDKSTVYASSPRYNWPYKPRLEGEAAICSFCRRTMPCADIHSNNYPFAVATEHFRNFFSNLRLEPKICSLCELASLLAVNCVFFNLSDRRRRLFLAIPDAQSLSELNTFWRDIPPQVALKPLNQPSNILDEGYRYRHLNESILAFSLELYLKLKEVKEHDKMLAEISSKAWHFYFASKDGKTVSFEGYAHFTDLHRLFGLFSNLESPEEFKETFQNLGIQEGKQWRTEFRDKIAQRIIKNAPLNEVVERIVWKRGYVKGLTDFVEQYNLWRG